MPPSAVAGVVAADSARLPGRVAANWSSVSSSNCAAAVRSGHRPRSHSLPLRISLTQLTWLCAFCTFCWAACISRRTASVSCAMSLIEPLRSRMPSYGGNFSRSACSSAFASPSSREPSICSCSQSNPFQAMGTPACGVIAATSIVDMGSARWANLPKLSTGRIFHFSLFALQRHFYVQSCHFSTNMIWVLRNSWTPAFLRRVDRLPRSEGRSSAQSPSSGYIGRIQGVSPCSLDTALSLCRPNLGLSWLAHRSDGQAPAHLIPVGLATIVSSSWAFSLSLRQGGVYILLPLATVDRHQYWEHHIGGHTTA